jgi:uncharacterized protein with GYD domain
MGMAKYLVAASYTAEGIAGVMKEGGTARVNVVEKMVAGLGGKVESFHFAFGADDAFVIIDLPDNVSAAALGLAVGASKAVNVRTTVLLTPEEVDRAAKMKVDYTAPGA